MEDIRGRVEVALEPGDRLESNCWMMNIPEGSIFTDNWLASGCYNHNTKSRSNTSLKQFKSIYV
jgi:hypothetical protein